MIDLATLPSPSVIEPLDYERILAECKADFALRMRPHLPAVDELLALESDPIVKLLEAHAYRELLFRARVNDAARAHLLAFAAGGDLDQLAALFGLQRMAGEGDDRLRLRLQKRIAALGAQGTREHYEWHALTASAQVRSAIASQPAPGQVRVMLWLADGADAAAVQATVLAALQHDAARMLGVVLSVQVAQPLPIHISARIVRSANAAPDLLAQLPARLAAALQSLATSGASVARSYLTSALHVPGVHAVEWLGESTPAATTTVPAGLYPVLGTVQLIDGGVAQ